MQIELIIIISVIIIHYYIELVVHHQIKIMTNTYIADREMMTTMMMMMTKTKTIIKQGSFIDISEKIKIISHFLIDIKKA